MINLPNVEKTESDTNFSQITHLNKQHCSYPQEGRRCLPFYEILAARCWLLYTGTNSNYLAIIIIV